MMGQWLFIPSSDYPVLNSSVQSPLPGRQHTWCCQLNKICKQFRPQTSVLGVNLTWRFPPGQMPVLPSVLPAAIAASAVMPQGDTKFHSLSWSHRGGQRAFAQGITEPGNRRSGEALWGHLVPLCCPKAKSAAAAHPAVEMSAWPFLGDGCCLPRLPSLQHQWFYLSHQYLIWSWFTAA